MTRTCLLLLGLISIAVPAHATSTITRSVIGSGGGPATSATHTMIGTLGQSVAGRATASANLIDAGFWTPAGTTVSVDVAPDVPEAFRLRSSAPNPFNPATAIAYDVPSEGGHVRLVIYDVTGRPIRVLVDGQQAPGRHTMRWDGRDQAGHPLASGVYFLLMEAPGYRSRHKMTLLK